MSASVLPPNVQLNTDGEVVVKDITANGLQVEMHQAVAVQHVRVLDREGPQRDTHQAGVSSPLAERVGCRFDIPFRPAQGSDRSSSRLWRTSSPSGAAVVDVAGQRTATCTGTAGRPAAAGRRRRGRTAPSGPRRCSGPPAGTSAGWPGSAPAPTCSASWSPRRSCHGASSSPSRASSACDEQRRLEAVAAGQQAVVQVRAPAGRGRLGQAGDAQHLLDAEPQRLAVLEDERERAARRGRGGSGRGSALGVEELAASAGELLQRQQVVERQRCMDDRSTFLAVVGRIANPSYRVPRPSHMSWAPFPFFARVAAIRRRDDGGSSTRRSAPSSRGNDPGGRAGPQGLAPALPDGRAQPAPDSAPPDRWSRPAPPLSGTVRPRSATSATRHVSGRGRW